MWRRSGPALMKKTYHGDIDLAKHLASFAFAAKIIFWETYKREILNKGQFMLLFVFDLCGKFDF